MEVFTLLMKKNISESESFKFHQGCKKLEVTHLCFGDDLLVFCHGDCGSVRVIKKTLEDFSQYSGLKPNIQKSTIFFGGLSTPEQEALHQIIPFSIGKLPMRYLGVPLVTKKISVNDCKTLVDKVRIKFQDWKNRSLSYVGRLQLIASILSSMQIYWASVFMLPKSVVKDINKVLKGFLWCKGELTKGKAKVSWANICRPKDQGGIGLKDLQKWNEVLIMKHLWNVAAKKDNLWVKWINVEKLKGRSIWEVESDSNSSSIWKSLLELRSKMRKHIYFKIGNGVSVSAWYDKWCNIGPLCEFISTRMMYDARLDQKCRVAKLIQNGNWCWPSEWVENSALNQIPVPQLLEDVMDKAVWINSNDQVTKYKTKTVWSDMCSDSPKVIWKSLVWFSQCIPRHSFVLWIAVQNRLMTQDRLAIWMPNEPMKCALCSHCPDSHEHLFFSCSYSYTIWSEMQKMLNKRVSYDWHTTIEELARMNVKNSIDSVVRRLVFGATVYFICRISKR